MERMLNLDKFTKEQIAEIAINKFKTIKLQDDLYIIPRNIASSELIDNQS